MNRSLHPYAACCKRYSISAKHFSYALDIFDSDVENRGPREDFLVQHGPTHQMISMADTTGSFFKTLIKKAINRIECVRFIEIYELA